jgi:hypothetical protein
MWKPLYVTVIGLCLSSSGSIVPGVYAEEPHDCEKQPPQPQNGGNHGNETVSSKSILSKGMALPNALKLLENNRVKYEVIDSASASGDPAKELREFLITPSFKTTDALVIAAISPLKKDDYVVTRISWHLNWKEDSAYPLWLRDDKVLDLEKIDVSILRAIPAEILQKRSSYKPNHSNPFQ